MQRYMYVHRSLFETLLSNNGILKIIKQQTYHDKLYFFFIFVSIYTISVRMQGYTGLIFLREMSISYV